MVIRFCRNTGVLLSPLITALSSVREAPPPSNEVVYVTSAFHTRVRRKSRLSTSNAQDSRHLRRSVASKFTRKGIHLHSAMASVLRPQQEVGGTGSKL